MTGDTAQQKRGISNPVAIGLLLIFVIVVDVLAFLLFPPFDKEEPEALTCEFPVCFINGTLELPAPHVVWIPGGAAPSTDLLTFQVSLTSSLITMFIITVLVIVAAVGTQPRPTMSPGARQNAIEHVYELLENFGMSLGGPPAQALHPAVRGFFLLILFCNWSGLIPPIGKIDQLRAPHQRHERHHRPRPGRVRVHRVPRASSTSASGYLGKFFPFGEFKNGIGAGRHRPVRRADRAAARVRQAGHAVDATLRQHLRRRGRAGRPHGPDPRDHPDGHAGPRGHAQRRAGAHLRHPDPHVHARRDRGPRHEEHEAAESAEAHRSMPSKRRRTDHPTTGPTTRD